MKRLLFSILIILILLLSACEVPSVTQTEALTPSPAAQPVWAPEPVDAGAAAIVMAASNSSAESKTRADYICDGNHDQKEIQAAIDATYSLGGGQVYFTEGDYYIAAGSFVTQKSKVDLIGSSGVKIHIGETCELLRLWGKQVHSLKDDKDNWFMVSGSATFANEGTIAKEHEMGSLKVIVTETGEAMRTFTADDWTPYEFIAIWVKTSVVEDEVSLRLWDSKGNYSQWNKKLWRSNTWQEFLVPRSEPSISSGEVDWSDITEISLTGLDAGTYYFDSIRVLPGRVRVSSLCFIGEETPKYDGTTVFLWHYAAESSIDNCSFRRISDESMEVHHCRKIIISHNVIKGNQLSASGQGGQSGGGIEVDYGGRLITVISNILREIPAHSVAITAGGEQISIIGNIIDGSGDGIWIRGGYPAKDWVPGWQGMIATNNSIKNVGYGIRVSYKAQQFIISGNTIEGVMWAGINLNGGDASSDYGLITGNQIINASMGIAIGTNCVGTKVRDNSFSSVERDIVDHGTLTER